MLPSMDLLEDSDRRVVGGYQKKIARHLLELSGMEELKRFSTQRGLPSQVLGTFRRVMELFDESTRYLLGRLHHRGMIIQCRPDCSYCCYNMPSGLSILELIGVYHGSRLTGMSSRLFRRCLEAGELWDSVLHSHSPDEGGGAAPRIPGCAKEELLKCYLKRCVPCPFLQRSSCIIYPYRPFACRMHFSLSPRHWCNPQHFQNAHAVSFNLEPGECVQNALDQVDDRFCLNISDIMVCGFLELTVNIMQFEPIRWA